jgi:undecaprenyl-diphosphatase
MEVEYLHEIVLGLIQGLTEFLPVSSAAHLILLPRLLGWEDQGLEMDVAAHLGTLCAVIYYFRHEFKAMFSSAYSSRCSFSDPQSRYLWFLILATVPVAITGLVAGDIVANHLRHPLVIASATLFFAVVLWTSDYFGKRNRGENSLTPRHIPFRDHYHGRIDPRAGPPFGGAFFVSAGGPDNTAGSYLRGIQIIHD